MLAGVGCSGTAPSVPERTASLVEACLQSVKLPVTHVPRGTTLIDSLRPRPVTLLSVADLLQGAPAQPGALIALYSTDAAANGVFGSLRQDARTQTQQRDRPLSHHASTDTVHPATHRRVRVWHRRAAIDWRVVTHVEALCSDRVRLNPASASSEQPHSRRQQGARGRSRRTTSSRLPGRSVDSWTRREPSARASVGRLPLGPGGEQPRERLALLLTSQSGRAPTQPVSPKAEAIVMQPQCDDLKRATADPVVVVFRCEWVLWCKDPLRCADESRD